MRLRNGIEGLVSPYLEMGIRPNRIKNVDIKKKD